MNTTTQSIYMEKQVTKTTCFSGSKAVIETLLREGVDTVFGYPGGTIMPVYDALYDYRDRLNHILVRHEQGALHAAQGYARVSGRPGVCIVTSGPGATNTVTGLADAMMDSTPVVLISGQVGSGFLGTDAFQETNFVGITQAVTKWNCQVRHAADIPAAIAKAFYIARTGRPGPVVVDITKDVTAASCEYTPKKPESVERAGHYTQEDLDAALEVISKAKKPYIYLGGGAILSGASEEVRAFAKKLDSPVCDTLMGKGAYDGYDPLYTGMIGMHGTKTSNLGVSECDLLVALGARFSDRVIGNASLFAKNAKILHIDIDAAEINKNIHADVSIVGDLKDILTKLIARMEQMHHPEWTAHILELKEKYPLKYDDSQLSCPYIIEELDRITKGNAIITTDVGQHQMWAAQYYHYTKPRTFLSSGGLGTMGYGIGASIGAKTGCPDKICVNIGGDGCFRMNLIELATASRYQIPIIQIIINNHVLGMVRQWQTLFYGKRYSQTVLEDAVDYCKVAEGLGCAAIRVTAKEEVAPAIEKAIALQKPVVIDCRIPEDDKVFPMVPAGAAISEVFDGDDLASK